MIITQGGEDHLVIMSGLQTVEDLFNEIKLAGANIDIDFDDTGRFLTLQSIESGTTLSIGENGTNR